MNVFGEVRSTLAAQVKPAGYAVIFSRQPTVVLWNIAEIFVTVTHVPK